MKKRRFKGRENQIRCDYTRSPCKYEASKFLQDIKSKEFFSRCPIHANNFVSGTPIKEIKKLFFFAAQIHEW